MLKPERFALSSGHGLPAVEVPSSLSKILSQISPEKTETQPLPPDLQMKTAWNNFSGSAACRLWTLYLRAFKLLRRKKISRKAQKKKRDPLVWTMDFYSTFQWPLTSIVDASLSFNTRPTSNPNTHTPPTHTPPPTQRVSFRDNIWCPSRDSRWTPDVWKYAVSGFPPSHASHC